MNGCVKPKLHGSPSPVHLKYMYSGPELFRYCDDDIMPVSFCAFVLHWLHGACGDIYRIHLGQVAIDHKCLFPIINWIFDKSCRITRI